MDGWHHRRSGRELGLTLAGGEGQGSLECCCAWGAESRTAGRLRNSGEPEAGRAAHTRRLLTLLPGCGGHRCFPSICYASP